MKIRHVEVCKLAMVRREGTIVGDRTSRSSNLTSLETICSPEEILENDLTPILGSKAPY